MLQGSLLQNCGDSGGHSSYLHLTEVGEDCPTRHKPQAACARCPGSPDTGSLAVQLPPAQPLAFAADSRFRSTDTCAFLSAHSKTSRGPRHLLLSRLLPRCASRSWGTSHCWPEPTPTTRTLRLSPNAVLHLRPAHVPVLTVLRQMKSHSARHTELAAPTCASWPAEVGRPDPPCTVSSGPMAVQTAPASSCWAPVRGSDRLWRTRNQLLEASSGRSGPSPSQMLG